MTSTIPAKKLFKTAFYTSVLIGPVTIVPDTIIKSVPVIEFFKEIFLHALFIFFIWTINISLVYLTEKYISKRLPVYTKYLLSYII